MGVTAGVKVCVGALVGVGGAAVAGSGIVGVTGAVSVGGLSMIGADTRVCGSLGSGLWNSVPLSAKKPIIPQIPMAIKPTKMTAMTGKDFLAGCGGIEGMCCG